METEFSRRRFPTTAAGALVSAGVVARNAAAQIPEAPLSETPATEPPPVPASGPPFQPVVTLNGWSLPWRTNGDVTEFHLIAQPVVREIAPGMTNHPIHLHGHSFEVTGTDGGWVPPTARWPEATIDVGVGQMRAIELVADAPGDRAFHCHKTHHTMNAMGHEVMTSIGVDFEEAAGKLRRLIPGYMVMGDRGMAEMASMQVELPENTLPMMTGEGPYGPIGMGGMFTVVKVRADQPPGDCSGPGWYEPPPGSMAYRSET